MTFKMKILKVFLRLSIAVGFLSAVADRFGLWPKEVSAWGNWNNFLDYTQLINPWFPQFLIPFLGICATSVEILFAVCLLIGFKTELFAKSSGVLLLLFGLSMILALGIKPPLDYSVFPAAAAAFALGMMKEKFLEIDTLMKTNHMV